MSDDETTRGDVWSLSNDQDYQNLIQQFHYGRTQLERKVTDQIHRSSGKGGYLNQYQNNFVNMDKFGHRILSSTSELSGLTFITRPKLNLSTVMLKQDPALVSLNTMNPTSVAFMIRMLLDTRLSKAALFREFVNNSPIFDPMCPWLFPLYNNLTDISGFPDPTIDVHTSNGGFFNEQISMAAGSDRMRRTFEIQMTFNDTQNGPIMALFQFWLEWMALLCQGITTPYIEDIEQRRLPYTVSIYRFTFDPSRRFITRWAKATGCFPRAVPVGSVFNVSQGEVFNSSAAKFSVPFTCNVFEAQKPTILMDFNILAERYCPEIANDKIYKTAPMIPEYNFVGLPYIVSTPRGYQMLWRFRPEDDPNIMIEELDSDVLALSKLSKELNDYEQFESVVDNDTSTYPGIYKI